MDSSEKYETLQNALAELEKAKEAILTAINCTDSAARELLMANASEGRERLCNLAQKLVSAKWTLLSSIHDLKCDYQLKA